MRLICDPADTDQTGWWRVILNIKKLFFGQWLRLERSAPAILAMALAAFSGTAALAADPLPVTEIAPGLFAFAGTPELMNGDNIGAIANIGFVIGENAVAVIDTGGSVREGERLRAAIAARTSLPIRYVINTHVHPDHIFGNAAFEGEGVVFAGHKNLPRALASRGTFYINAFRPLMGEALVADIRIIAPTLLVDGETTIDLGHRKLVLKAWKTSHSDSDLTVLDEQSRTLFSGDLVFLQHTPVVDGSLLGLLSVMDEIVKIPALRVVPGHGPAVADWPQAMAAQKGYFDRLAKDLRAMIARGTDVGEAARSAGQSEAPNWKLFGDFNPRNATAGFAELEWE